VCCAYLLTLSEYFKWVKLSDFGLSPRLALQRECKDEARGLAFGDALRVDSLDSKGEVVKYKVYGWCNVQVDAI